LKSIAPDGISRGFHTLHILLWVTILAGCYASAPRPVFPDAQAVSSLSVKDGAAVREPRRIAEFLDALKALDRQWKYTWHTYPTPQAVVMLVDANNRPLCAIDLGPNWLGSTCGHSKPGWPPFVELTPEQALYFRTFVDGKWPI